MPSLSHFSILACAARRCDEDVNECEQRGCGDGGRCVNTLGSFYCNCSEGYAGPFCDQRTSDDEDDDDDAQVERRPDFDARTMSRNAFTFCVGVGVVFFFLFFPAQSARS